MQELSPLGSRLLAGVPLTSRWHVLALLQPVALAPGQQLCWEGQPAEHIWLMQEGSVVTLDGVVPRLDSFNDSPGMLLAFDALAWLQQQRTCLQQRQQQQQQAWLDTNTGNGTSSSRQKPSQQYAAAPPHGLNPAAAAAPRYTVSYQAVGSSFFWALPLQQLGLAFSGSDGPRLIDSFEAELASLRSP
ncbi:hypothetical protein OEZ85_012638 [Tetradesmus obliquus]|uniref:Cyclic nucleotide-binding domain-containing protein n=1 Tax=Tetradesmus obliquus TaxID=3088 RepID=A0ABY8U444_TETOB|nr:hypothetical protein OEZ85_012638 [Tetradesmus obliquus]